VWADLAIVFMAIPFLIIGLLFLVVTGAIVFGLYKVLDYLPSITVQGQDFTLKLKQNVRMFSDRIATPIITIDSIGKAIRRALHSIGSIFRRK
jgi:predicted PurR-regulated permease PerM